MMVCSQTSIEGTLFPFCANSPTVFEQNLSPSVAPNLAQDLIPDIPVVCPEQRMQ